MRPGERDQLALIVPNPSGDRSGGAARRRSRGPPTRAASFAAALPQACPAPALPTLMAVLLARLQASEPVLRAMEERATEAARPALRRALDAHCRDRFRAALPPIDRARLV